jgi:hypothetical protein
MNQTYAKSTLPVLVMTSNKYHGELRVHLRNSAMMVLFFFGESLRPQEVEQPAWGYSPG